MNSVVADTHALVWYILEPEKLSAKAQEALDGAWQAGEPIYMASITLVEVWYLTEKGRLPRDIYERLVEVMEGPDAGVVLVPLDLDIVEALRAVPREVISDMPDRIIAATAQRLGVPLVSRDGRIQASGLNVIW